MVLAHAFGERYDLPLPLVLFVLGGAAAVVASFAVVVHRDSPRAHASAASDAGRPRNARPIPTAGSIGLLLALIAAGLWGSQEVVGNIVPSFFWLLIWIAVPVSCGVLGDWTGPVNPFANLGRLADSNALRRALLGGADPLRWPDRLGWWPACLLFAVLACGELVFATVATLPRVIATGLLLYGVVSAFLGLLFGAQWLARGEVFTVLFGTWGRLGWFRFGAPGERGFAGGLGVPFERSVGRTAFVLLLLISVNFDGLLATPQWARLEGGLASPVGGRAELRLAGLLVITLAVYGLFGVFAAGSARVGRHHAGVRTALSGLLPSLLPIAFGYLLAHNLQYLLVNSQLLLPLVGNPIGRPGWPVHLPYPFSGAFEPDPRLLPAAFYWYAAVAAIVAAHIAAVVVAHRHLAAAAPDRSSAHRSEYPWLVAMVAYTVFSLYLIAQPLATEQPASEARGLRAPLGIAAAGGIAGAGGIR